MHDLALSHTIGMCWPKLAMVTHATTSLGFLRFSTLVIHGL